MIDLSKPLMTREGNEVVLFSEWEKLGLAGEPTYIYGLIIDADQETVYVAKWSKPGHILYSERGVDRGLDLVNKKRRMTRWLNVFRTSETDDDGYFYIPHPSEHNANINGQDRIACIKIEFED